MSLLKELGPGKKSGFYKYFALIRAKTCRRLIHVDITGRNHGFTHLVEPQFCIKRFILLESLACPYRQLNPNRKVLRDVKVFQSSGEDA